MKKPTSLPIPHGLSGILVLGWLLLTLLAYGRLLLHPDLHTACPENDTWNLPVRFSVLFSLRNGEIPLWNPLSAFGIPWLASWATEVFYPGTLLFKWFGLSAWNFSGILHLLVLSTGVYFFLMASGVKPFWAFFSAAISLLNGCAYNHLGSNAPMDTMAWIPWIFWAARRCVERQPCGRLWLGLFFILQVFAGYPQIIFYTLAGCFSYAVFLKGWKSLGVFILPLGAGLLLSAAQWIPSMEYFFLQCVRFPAVPDNPHFFLPLENFKTFFDFNALSKDGKPDYVVNPTYFYFNFYSGLIPLVVLVWGLLRFTRLKPLTRFFLVGFPIGALWSLGYLLMGLDFFRIPFPSFLEPAKSWVLVNFFELAAIGLLLEDLLPKPGKWKWSVLVLGIFNLLLPVWNHPLERNLTPGDLQPQSDKILAHQRQQGHILVLPNAEEHARLYTPLPDREGRALFKHFVPNSNLYGRLPLANFYSSTWPSWGTYDAERYLQYGFPYGAGSLIDLLGVDLLYLSEEKMPSRFKKIESDDSWTLWENPGSVGFHYFFYGSPKNAGRKEAFSAFASGSANPRKDLFFDPTPISLGPQHDFTRMGFPTNGYLSFTAPGKSGLYLVVTENAMPGWRAWIDGKPSAVYLADGIFQCVPVTGGSKTGHEIRLGYEPASFRLGLFLSLMSLGGLLALAGLRKSMLV